MREQRGRHDTLLLDLWCFSCLLTRVSLAVCAAVSVPPLSSRVYLWICGCT